MDTIEVVLELLTHLVLQQRTAAFLEERPRDAAAEASALVRGVHDGRGAGLRDGAATNLDAPLHPGSVSGLPLAASVRARRVVEILGRAIISAPCLPGARER